MSRRKVLATLSQSNLFSAGTYEFHVYAQSNLLKKTEKEQLKLPLPSQKILVSKYLSLTCFQSPNITALIGTFFRAVGRYILLSFNQMVIQ